MIDSSLHSEGRRQAYLAALGIPLWTVRQELTYAAPSTQTQFVAYEDAFFADVTVVEVEPLLEEMPPLIQSKPTPPRESSIISGRDSEAKRLGVKIYGSQKIMLGTLLFVSVAHSSGR